MQQHATKMIAATTIIPVLSFVMDHDSSMIATLASAATLSQLSLFSHVIDSDYEQTCD